MEENQTPPTSTEPFVVEEPQEPARKKGRPAQEDSAQEAPAIRIDDLLKADADPDAEPGDGPATGAPAAEVDVQRAAAILESLLLVSSEPLPIEKARRLLGELSRDQFEEVFLALRAKYPPETSGILVEKVAKGVQFRTNPSNQEHVRRLFDVKPPRFSRAALETVAIIAYKQPLTRQEIEQIRGVDCAGSLRTLMDRRLVRVVGKKDVPGKPFLLGTTREFMEVFGLGSLGELPSMREIEEFLSSSAATPVESGRASLDLPFSDGDAAGAEPVLQEDPPQELSGEGDPDAH
jgi:segregation and condensation protein B